MPRGPRTKEPALPVGETKYPDTAAGVRQMLVDDSTLSDKDFDGAVFTPDPAAEGVWKVQLAQPADDGWETTAAIAYLAGYPDPWGDIVTDNDFEMTDDPAELATGGLPDEEPDDVWEDDEWN